MKTEWAGREWPRHYWTKCNEGFLIARGCRRFTVGLPEVVG